MTDDGGREILRELFRHNLWANRQLIDHCAGLPDELLDVAAAEAYGSPRETLVHLVAAEERYVALITGREPDEPLSESDDFPGFDALLEHAASSGEALVEAAAHVAYADTWSGHYRGQDWEINKVVALLQAINHATEHREQVKAALTRAGAEVPSLDGWIYGGVAGLMRQVG